LLAVTAAIQALPAQNTTSFDHVEYLPTKNAGEKSGGHSVKGALIMDPQKKFMNFVDKKGASVVSIPFDSIKSLLYEQTSKPRYAEALLISPLFLLAPSKSHFLTIQYLDSSQNGQVAILHLDKKNSHEIVATAEAMTGKKVERAKE
jgi:hypothetical protein